MEQTTWLSEYFTDRGFQKMNSTTQSMEVYYTSTTEKVFVYWMLYLPRGMECKAEQYQQVEEQLKLNFRGNASQEIQITCFLCTYHAQNAKSLCRENNSACIVDLTNHRLLLFEGQTRDELSVFSELEQLISAREKVRTITSSPIKKIVLSLGLVTTCLTLLNILVFAITELRGTQSSPDLILEGALHWPSFKYNHEYYRIITYMFLHGGANHLVNNMLILCVIGSMLERTVGRFRFISIYFLSGIVAAIVSMSYNTKRVLSMSYTIGASGAVFGVVGAVACIILVNRGRLETLNRKRIILFTVLSLYGGFVEQNVDNAAHIGGLIAGALLTLILYRKKG